MKYSEFQDDNQMARFGHTITPIGKNKAILFGGAVEDTGKYVMTEDIFICDYDLKKWKKIQCKGISPSKRAAHSAICIKHYLFVYGGALGDGQLADQNLYQLNLLTIDDKQKISWSIKQTNGPSPGRRYGHVMGYLKPYLIVHGGNTRSQTVGDLWKIDILGSCIWQKLQISKQQSPPPRVYHSASICRTGIANGMMTIFGGRGSDQAPMNDTWGLRKHRDGHLDWMRAPYRKNKFPAKRYQHSSMFIGTLLLIIGGRSNQIGQAMSLDVYDTDTSDWYKLRTIQRSGHSCFLIEHNLYIHGGFDQQTPNILTNKLVTIDLNQAFNKFPILFKGLGFQLGKDIITHNQNRNNLNNTQLKSSTRQLKNSIQQKQSVNYQNKKGPQKIALDVSNSNDVQRNFKKNKSIRLCSEAVVANFDQQNQVKKIPINMLSTQHKRLVKPINLISTRKAYQKVYQFFLNSLLCRPIVSLNFPIQSQYIQKLVEGVCRILDQQSNLVKLSLPVKIFGDIHGQINQLNNFFDSFGCPSNELQNGDIQFTNYIFLGDYVDRGTQNLQTILLLLSLKLKYPQNIFLLRGAHQDRKINKFMGFGDECAYKLKQNIDDPNSVWNLINKVFDIMPIAALVQDKILCVHAGVGQTVRNLTQIQSIRKPYEINFEPKSRQQKIIYQLLWTDSQRESQSSYFSNLQLDYFKLKNNPKFSQDRVNDFCDQNNLMTIVRSHEPIAEGYQFKQSYITVFSCSDYGGFENKAGILHIMKNQEFVPKVLNSLSGKNRWMNIYQTKAQKTTKNQNQILRKQNIAPSKKR